MSNGNKYCHRCGTLLPPNADFCPNCGVNAKADVSEPLYGQPKEHFSNRLNFNITRNVRVIIFFFFVAVFLIGLTLGSFAPISLGNAESLTSSVQNQVNRSSFISLVESIARNNIVLCLVFFVPVFGQIFMALTSYSTGLVISAEAIANSVNRLTLLQNLFFYPSTWLETVVYGLAASESIIFLLCVIKGDYKKEIKRLVLTIVACVVILTISAVIESLLIL
jgi:hypothetical protein